MPDTPDAPTPPEEPKQTGSTGRHRAAVRRGLAGVARQGARLGRRGAAGIGRMSWRGRLALGAGVIVLGGVLVAGIAVAALEDLDELEAQRVPELRFDDAEGAPLMIGGQGPSDHAGLARIPDMLEEAVIAQEDQRFREHRGLDWRSIARAVWTNATAGEIVEGGSTISQQLVKISYLDPERTYRRKLHEALLTRELEARYSKDEILERYLNRVYLGNGARGVAAAAQVYFGKPVEELTLAESAALAASIRAPSVVNPVDDPDGLRVRAEALVKAMERQGRIDGGAVNQALAGLTVMAPQPARPPYGGWFADWVGGQADALTTRFTDAGAVRTTLEPALQRRAEQVVAQALAGQGMQAALVALRPDGQVAAMVGGRDYGESQFNRVTQARRQPGSTFKTFVYLTAFADGYSPDDRIEDREFEIDGYSPQNFDGRFHGPVTLREAFTRSYNAATVALASTVGVDRVAETARTLGIRAELSETPSLALGASEVTLLELTAAYGSLATGKVMRAHGIQGITAGAEETYYPFDWAAPAPSSAEARLMQARPQMTELLRQVVTDGTGRAASGVPGAVGKTGTSQNFRDALFVGWTGELIVGVWVGNDDNTPMDGVTGGRLPAQIWAAFLDGAEIPAAPDSQPQAQEADDTPLAAVLTDIQRPDRPAVDDGVEPRLSRAMEAIRATGRVSAAEADALGQAIRRELQSGSPDVQALQRMVIETLGTRVSAAGGGQQCDVRACDRAYRSFRASDCTYQPYGGGPRAICTR